MGYQSKNGVRFGSCNGSANNVTYNNKVSGLSSNTAQTAIDELATSVVGVKAILLSSNWVSPSDGPSVYTLENEAFLGNENVVVSLDDDGTLSEELWEEFDTLITDITVNTGSITFTASSVPTFSFPIVIKGNVSVPEGESVGLGELANSLDRVMGEYAVLKESIEKSTEYHLIGEISGVTELDISNAITEFDEFVCIGMDSTDTTNYYKHIIHIPTVVLTDIYQLFITGGTLSSTFGCGVYAKKTAIYISDMYNAGASVTEANRTMLVYGHNTAIGGGSGTSNVHVGDISIGAFPDYTKALVKIAEADKTWVATEDCILIGTVTQKDASHRACVYVDDVIVFGGFVGDSTYNDNDGNILVKKGQTVRTYEYGTYNLTAYALQNSSSSVVMIDTQLDYKNKVDLKSVLATTDSVYRTALNGIINLVTRYEITDDSIVTSSYKVSSTRPNGGVATVINQSGSDDTGSQSAQIHVVAGELLQVTEITNRSIELMEYVPFKEVPNIVNTITNFETGAFPDYTNVIKTINTAGASWTATQDCFIIGQIQQTDASTGAYVYVDGVQVSGCVVPNTKNSIVFDSIFVKKNQVVTTRSNYGSYNLKAYGITYSDSTVALVNNELDWNNVSYPFTESGVTTYTATKPGVLYVSLQIGSGGSASASINNLPVIYAMDNGTGTTATSKRVERVVMNKNNTIEFSILINSSIDSANTFFVPYKNKVSAGSSDGITVTLDPSKWVDQGDGTYKNIVNTSAIAGDEFLTAKVINADEATSELFDVAITDIETDDKQIVFTASESISVSMTIMLF